MHNKKCLVAVVAALFCSAAVFAEMPMYLKGTLGFEYRYAVYDFDYPYEDVFGHNQKVALKFADYSARFAVNPAFGMVFAPDSDNAFFKGLGAEAGVGIGFGGGGSISAAAYGGGKGDFSVISIVPRVNAVWHWLFDDATFDKPQTFVPHFIAGFELPIQIPSSDLDLDTSVSFGVDIGAGFTINVTDKIGIVADFAYTLPFGNAYGIAISAGATYRLK